MNGVGLCVCVCVCVCVCLVHTLVEFLVLQSLLTLLILIWN